MVRAMIRDARFPRPDPALRRAVARAGAVMLAAAAAASALASSPRVAPYTVVNGAGIEAPLGGLTGDAARGAALFADPAAGACASCHGFAGAAPTGAAPGVILAAIAPEPEPQPDAPLDDAAQDDGPGLGPLAAPLPLPRGAATLAGAEDAAPQDGPELPEDMTLTMGPALDGAAARLGAGTLRLWIVDPSLAGGQGAMPGFHAVDFEAAARAPDLRQPWLSAQDIEDIIAYLTAAEEPAPAR